MLQPLSLRFPSSRSLYCAFRPAVHFARNVAQELRKRTRRRTSHLTAGRAAPNRDWQLRRAVSVQRYRGGRRRFVASFVAHRRQSNSHFTGLASPRYFFQRGRARARRRAGIAVSMCKMYVFSPCAANVGHVECVMIPDAAGSAPSCARRAVRACRASLTAHASRAAPRAAPRVP